MILDCQNICKSFGTDVILNNISFHLEEKEKMAIVGINGAGKTTLLKIIMGEEEADSGQVIISTEPSVISPSIRRAITTLLSVESCLML